LDNKSAKRAIDILSHEEDGLITGEREENVGGGSGGGGGGGGGSGKVHPEK